MPTHNDLGQPVGDAVPGWTPRALPARKTLKGLHVSLEPLDAARHANDLFAAFAAAPDARDFTYLAYERPDTRAACAQWLAPLESSRDPLFFTVFEPGSSKALGILSLMRIDPANGVIEIGHIAYAPALQRTAAASEAIYLLLAYAFDDLGYRRCEWKCDSLNARSRRAALRFGFVFEGLFRNALVYKGRNRDTAWYAITVEGWPHVKSGFQAWLDAANFDDQGRQLKTLGDIIGRRAGTVAEL